MLLVLSGWGGLKGSSCSLRLASPRHGFTIMNRLSMENLTEPITKDLDFQLQDPFLLYRNARCKCLTKNALCSKANLFGYYRTAVQPASQPGAQRRTACQSHVLSLIGRSAALALCFVMISSHAQRLGKRLGVSTLCYHE